MLISQTEQKEFYSKKNTQTDMLTSILSDYHWKHFHTRTIYVPYSWKGNVELWIRFNAHKNANICTDRHIRPSYVT